MPAPDSGSEPDLLRQWREGALVIPTGLEREPRQWRSAPAAIFTSMDSDTSTAAAAGRQLSSRTWAIFRRKSATYLWSRLPEEVIELGKNLPRGSA